MGNVVSVFAFTSLRSGLTIPICILPLISKLVSEMCFPSQLAPWYKSSQ